ncbi:MAG TPA: c-type cytochrome domain-containing protein [Anaerolineales bacterium]|nr:c-type cytochrome domain-containing protein [Anaerolineales bacterium]
MKTKILILILIVGLLSACGSRSVEAPASPPTDEPASTTEAPTNPPASTDTAAPPTEPPTEGPTAESVASTGVSFTNEILPILQSRCLNCHGGDKVEEGLIVKTYAELMAGSDNGPVIIPGDAEGSLLVELTSSQEMPKRGPKLTPPQVQLIVDWVNQGALNN